MPKVNLKMYPKDTEMLVAKALCYAVSLSTELHLMFPQYDNTNMPLPDEINLQNRILCYVLNNAEIPDGYQPLIANTLYAIADHIETMTDDIREPYLLSTEPEMSVAKKAKILRDVAKNLDLISIDYCHERVREAYTAQVLEAAT